MKKSIISTIGHSTHPIDEFIRLLQAHDITEIIDVRSIPKSCHNPQYNAEMLKESLRKAGVRYRHIKKLGSLRHTTKDSLNTGWRNASFRGYADYMSGTEFEDGLRTLITSASKGHAAIMCAEAVPWRCHRSLIADALVKKGWLARDILSRTSAIRHRLTPFLKVKNGKPVYPAPKI